MHHWFGKLRDAAENIGSGREARTACPLQMSGLMMKCHRPDPVQHKLSLAVSEADHCKPPVNDRKVRALVVASRCGEGLVSDPSKSTPSNDRFGDVRCIATECALLMRAHAASAIAAFAQVRFVCEADIHRIKLL